MVKNSSGGKIAKTKARKNMTVRPTLKYEELIKTEDQEYAKILTVNGGGRYRVKCYDDIERLGISRSKINRNEKIIVGSIVLISKRDYQDNKCDILYVYNREEIEILIKYGDINSSFIDKENTDITSDIQFSNQQEEELEEWSEL